MGTSSFQGKQKAVTQQAHSFWPQWGKFNNGRDQCVQGQQRADKEFLKNQQACFTIYTALHKPPGKHCLHNLIHLKIRSAFIQLFFCWFQLQQSPDCGFNEKLFDAASRYLKSTVGPVVSIRCDTDLVSFSSLFPGPGNHMHVITNMTIRFNFGTGSVWQSEILHGTNWAKKLMREMPQLSGMVKHIS